MLFIRKSFTNMSLHYNSNNIPFAKELRKNATRHENKLWYNFLSTFKPRFQRQKAIGDYIADFYCHRAKLIIELDGSQHFTPEGKAYDEYRTNELGKFEIYVLRFSNRQIDENFQGVCKYITNVVGKLLAK